jgi:hypothetical protein
MARKKASHPPPHGGKLRQLIESNMMNIKTIPHHGESIDPTEWKLFNHPDILPRLLREVEANFTDQHILKGRRLENFLHPINKLPSDGWYQYDDGGDDWLVWLSMESNDFEDISVMRMSFLNDSVSEKSLDKALISDVYQHTTWGHSKGMEYTLIIPTDENKMYIRQFMNHTINWKRFPIVLLEGA